jgi:Ca2+-binding RTX toxin-like protein
MSDKQPARPFGQPLGGERIDFATGDPTHAPMTIETNTSIFGSSPNPTLAAGYNYGYGSNKPMPGEASMYWMVEGNYDQSHNGINQTVMEQYWEATSGDRTAAWRPIVVTADKSASNGSRTTLVNSLDLTGPAPGHGTGAIRFFSPTDVAPGTNALGGDEMTYSFGRANMIVSGFSDTDTRVYLNAGANRNSNIQFGANGQTNTMNVGTDAPQVGHIWVGSPAAEMRMIAVNGNNALSVGINSSGRNSAVLDVDLKGTWLDQTGIRVRQQAGGTGNLLQAEDSTGGVQSGFDKSGYIFTQRNTAPAAADLRNGEADLWFDSTAGSSRLVVTARDTGGTLVTGSVPLLPATATSTASLTPGAPAYDPVDGANVLSQGSGADTVNGLDVRDLIFGNRGDDVLYGNGADDLLFGGAGNDQLIGGAGLDTLWGNEARDLLTGGSGADTFAFAQNSGDDRITDFNAAEGDKLALNGQSYITGNDGQGNLSLTFSGGGTVALQGIAPTTTPNTSWFA